MTTTPYSRAALLVCVLVLGTGCHTYTPVASAALGSTVRVTVPVTATFGGSNAAPQTMSVEGVVVGVGDTLRLATSTRREYGAFREVMLVDTLRLSTAQAQSIELVEFSSKKSVGLGVIIAAGAATAGLLAFNSSRNGGDVPGTDPPEPESAFVISTSLVSFVLGLVGR